MAFDGITIACVRKELSLALEGGRISKIAQPEADELLITVKNNREQHRCCCRPAPPFRWCILPARINRGP